MGVAQIRDAKEAATNAFNRAQDLRKKADVANAEARKEGATAEVIAAAKAATAAASRADYDSGVATGRHGDLRARIEKEIAAAQQAAH